jgi:hypothetical protein
MKIMIVYLIVLLLIIIGLFLTTRENFSSSGLTISNDYCTKISNVYFDPKSTDKVYRDAYEEKICGHVRRKTIDPKTGNYYTENSILV